MKKFYLFATALVAMVSCTSDDFIGENNNSPDLNPGNGTESAIVFNSGAKKVTRADFTGAVAADMLNNNFVFMGTKTVSSTSSPKVFDHYNANWVESTANTTESNSNDWEYVGYTPVAGLTSLPAGATQSIKYWDYAASQYDFAAYSLGKGDDPNDLPNSSFATATSFDFDELGSGNPVYTLSGSLDQLKECYISDLVTHYNNTSIDEDAATTFGKVVNFTFRSLATKIRLAFYETIPGYSVKEVKFYNAKTGNLADNGTEEIPTLFTSSGGATLANGEGTIEVSFPTVGWDNSPEKSSTTANTDYNKAHVTFRPNSLTDDISATMTFDYLDDFSSPEKMELTGEYLGRTSNTATYAGGLENGSGKYFTVLPNEKLDANIDDLDHLMIRIKYTLVSTDGSNEEIVVDNATAVIPKQYANWHPNYAYTYIFKISNMTNGTTGVGPDGDPVMGLTPITLNAVVVDSADGIQETITTVSDPSITTYMAGKVVTENDEYIETADDHPIYIVVNDGSDNVTLVKNTNAKLYYAEVDAGALQTITEESVDNALRYGVLDNDDDPTTYTVTDAADKNLKLTDVTDDLTVNTTIAAAESPTGDAITLDNVSFVPESGKTYVFQYKGESTGTYGVYAAVEPGTLTSGNKYYTSTAGAGEFTADGSEKITTSSSYYTKVISYEAAGMLTTADTYYYYDPTDASANGDGYVTYTYSDTSTPAPAVSGGYFRQVTSYEKVPFATLTKDAIYYTTKRGAGKFIATGSEAIDAENKYWTESAAEVDGEYMYKIIKVAP